MKKYLIPVLTILLLSKILVLTSCANIIPPGGGPKDSLPPVLVSSEPKDSSLHFTSNRILLTFNEYVQLDNNLNDNLIVSPNPVNTPLVEGKLRTVNIKLRDSLLPNTTYSINFGNSLKDVNEGNVLKNFTYVFSSGNKISEGQLSGNVILAETGKTDSTLIVVLHKNLNDTAVKKDRPYFYTRLDGKGNFQFRNLPEGNFNVFVLPNDYSKKYDDSTKLFAFFNSPVTVTGSPQSLALYAFQQEKRKEETPAPEADNSKQKNATPNKTLRLASNLQSGKQDLLGNLELSLSRKFKKFDSAEIILTDTNYKALNNYSFIIDTSLTKVSLHFNWPENEFYKLIIQKTAFADTAGITLSKNDTISFQTKRESEYGSIRLHFNNLDLARNPVLLLVQGDKIVQSIALATNEWYQRLFIPGEYELRILFDDNKNGFWDAGNFKLKRQPEKVQLIPRKLNTKANWDNEVDINL